MEVFRTRDVVVFYKDITITADVTAEMAREGWKGGQAFNWTSSGDEDRLLVTKSDGVAAGFALWGSDESSDQFTAMTRNQPAYQYVVLAAGGWLISTSSYERHTYASRQSGPLVPIAYAPGDRLFFSLRGFWTVENELALSGDPRGSDGNFYGVVTQKPTAGRSWYLGVQVII